MTDEFIKHQLNREVESISLNQLNDLGNQAVSLGLIAGHGHHKGQYEIVAQGKIITLSPRQAIAYLRSLIQSAGERHA